MNCNLTTMMRLLFIGSLCIVAVQTTATNPPWCPDCLQCDIPTFTKCRNTYFYPAFNVTDAIWQNVSSLLTSVMNTLAPFPNGVYTPSSLNDICIAYRNFENCVNNDSKSNFIDCIQPTMTINYGIHTMDNTYRMSGLLQSLVWLCGGSKTVNAYTMWQSCLNPTWANLFNPYRNSLTMYVNNAYETIDDIVRGGNNQSLIYQVVDMTMQRVASNFIGVCQTNPGIGSNSHSGCCCNNYQYDPYVWACEFALLSSGLSMHYAPAYRCQAAPQKGNPGYGVVCDAKNSYKVCTYSDNQCNP